MENAIKSIMYKRRKKFLSFVLINIVLYENI